MTNALLDHANAAPLGRITARRPQLAPDDPDVLGTPVVVFFGMFAAAVYTYAVANG